MQRNATQRQALRHNIVNLPLGAVCGAPCVTLCAVRAIVPAHAIVSAVRGFHVYHTGLVPSIGEEATTQEHATIHVGAC